MNVKQATELISLLERVCSVDRKDALPSAFQKFTRVLQAFLRECEDQKSQLTDNAEAQRLAGNLNKLRETIPVLKSVTQNQVKYPRNAHAKASCELVESHIRRAVERILQAEGIQAGAPPQAPTKSPEGSRGVESHFAADVSKLVHLLSPKHRRSLLPELNTLVTRVVDHSMLVAVSSRERQKDEITKTTQEVLSLQDEVCNRYRALENRLDFVQLSCDFDESCESLARKVLYLEGALIDTVVQQVVDVLVQTTEPMTRIVKAATVHLKDDRVLTDEDCLSVLQPLDDRLHDHMDQLCQVGSFVAASCSDCDKVDKITRCVRAIESLDSEVLPACLAARRDSQDRTAVSHLKLFYRDWCSRVHALVDSMLDVINLERFLEISERSLESDLEDCRHAALMPDPGFLRESVNRMVGRTRQVLRVGGDIQNRSEDPLYRNGMQVYLDQIKNAIPLVKNGGVHAVRNIKKPLAQGQLKERCHHLIEAVRLLREGVNPEKQPGLANPLREHVRSNVWKKEESSENDANISPREPVTGTVSPRLAPSPRPHSLSSMPQSPRPQTLLMAMKANQSPLSVGSKGSALLPGPVFKLDLVFPAADILRGVFDQDQHGVVELLDKLRTKSSSLSQIAESLSNVQGLESITPALVTSLATTVNTLHSNTLAAISGVDSHQAECLLSADRWSTEYTVLEESVSERLQPWTSLFGGVGNPVDTEMVISEESRDAIGRMTSTLLNTMKVDHYCTATPEVAHQVTVWKDMSTDLQTKNERYRAGSENQSFKDHLSHKRMTCLVQLCRLVEAAVEYLGKRQERWVEVINRDNWIPQRGDWSQRVSKMQRETEGYLKLGNLISSWDNSDSEGAERFERLRDDIEDVCEMITDPRGYERAPVLTSLYLIEWACLMHQLSDILDRLSANAALRIDRLLSSAHAAHGSSGPSKQHFLVEFQGQSEALSSVVTHVRQSAVSALVHVPSHAHKTTVLASLDELCRVTPKLVSLSRDLAGDALPTLSELNHVKRLWVCHATSIVRGLQGLPHVDEKVLTGIERDLRGATSFRNHIENHPLPPQGYPTMNGSHRMPNGFVGVCEVSGPQTTISKRSAVGTTGHAGDLYADTSYKWQGEEPRLVTSSTVDTKPQDRPKGYRSQPLGLNDVSTSQLNTSSIPAASCKPPLRRTNSSNCYSSIEATALMLQQEADKWESSDNPYVQTVKRLSTNMKVLTRYAEKHDSSVPKSELIQAARVISTEASNIHRFAQIFTKYSKDAQFAEELEVHSKQIPALAKQLDIITTVKSATPADYNSDVVIVTNAERLMGAVVKTINAAETLCVKGLRPIEGASPSEAAAASLAAQVRRKLQRHRQIEASSHDIDALGLRRVGKHSSVPSLMEMFQKLS